MELSIARFAKPLSELVEHVLRADVQVRALIGKWEADVESYKLLLFAAQHARAVLALAKSDPAHEPSAAIISRACLEAGAKALWLLDPDDPFQREARWIAHLEGEAGTRRRLSEYLGEAELKAAEKIQNFVSQIRAKMPNGYMPPKNVPNVKDILTSVGLKDKYLLYIRTSQYSHGTHYGTGIYQRGLGTLKELGQFSDPAFWELTLGICWWFVCLPAIKLSDRYGVPYELAPIKIQKKFVAVQKSMS